MKRFVLAICFGLPLTLAGQIIVDTPLSARLTGYDIDAVLEPASHMIVSDMTAWWVNNSDAPVGDAMMHMYLNAFSSNKSTFARGGRWSPAGDAG